MMYQIMLVDDEENILKALKRVLSKEYEIVIETFIKPEEALIHARTKKFDLFLSDFRMPVMDGVKFLTEVKILQPESMRLILSGYTDLDALMGAINDAEIYRFITKPWQDYELVSTIKQALEFKDIQVENQRLADQVRDQQNELDKRKQVLDSYIEKHPELFKVNWTDDGSIVLDDEEY